MDGPFILISFIFNKAVLPAVRNIRASLNIGRKICLLLSINTGSVLVFKMSLYINVFLKIGINRHACTCLLLGTVHVSKHFYQIRSRLKLHTYQL